ncbi:hypothetical protein NEIFL0001_0391 [Neisseria flavescens SK114]|nr:hypothetical protein NEIFL0001_0391 [Neisseria flavescens SK114]
MFVFFNNVPFVDCVILIVAVLIDGWLTFIWHFISAAAFIFSGL